jgi:hypothetical protein
VAGGPTLWTPRIYEGGKHKGKRARARTRRGNPLEQIGGGCLNSTQLSFAVAASGALPARWAGVLTLRWPSFSGGFTMFHIFQAASPWSPVQLVGPRAPRNGGIHWVVSCPWRVGCGASMRWGPVPRSRVAARRFDEAPFSAASGDVGWALWGVGLWLNFSLSNGR